MKLSEKVKLYQNVFNNTNGIEFGKRNMILYNVAKDLGLKHWHTMTGCELCQHRRYDPLLVLTF